MMTIKGSGRDLIVRNPGCKDDELGLRRGSTLLDKAIFGLPVGTGITIGIGHIRV